MNVNGIFNPRTCRIFGWSTLFTAIVGVALYVIAGMIDVPPESPLANPNYVLRELNDVTIPWDAELPPGTVAPINLLNNGNPVITPWLVALLAFYILAMLFSLAAKKSLVQSVAYLMISQLFLVSQIIDTLVGIPFAYNSLRSGAQPLIDGSHRLRVAFAYIQLWCEKYNVIGANMMVKRLFSIVMLTSYALACVIEFLRWKREKAATSENRPVL